MGVTIGFTIWAFAAIYRLEANKDEIKSFVKVRLDPIPDCEVFINGKKYDGKDIFLSTKYTYSVDYIKNGQTVKHLDYQPK